MVSAPKLLVSIRSLEEARIALSAGVAILDIKEPNHGSLGAASFQTMQKVCDYVHSMGNVPVSAALGEIHEQAATPIAIPATMNYLKMGLTFHSTEKTTNGISDDWKSAWREVRAKYRETHAEAKWIAVAYVDHPETAPSIQETIQFAIEEGCAGVLLDTFNKDDRSLTSYLSMVEIEATIETVQSAGLEVALAGSLNLEDVQQLSQTSADILAVRSLACDGTKRNGTISSAAIKEIRSRM